MIKQFREIGPSVSFKTGIALKNASKAAKIIKLVDRIDNLCELDWSNGFAKVYAGESILLLNESLTGVNTELENELRDICERILS